MAEDASTAPLKPQETTNFLLGQISGQVGALQSSVQSSAANQATINAAHEVEHAKFREVISTVVTDVAVLKDAKKSDGEHKLSRYQLLGIWVGAPSGVAALIGLLAYINLNK